MVRITFSLSDDVKKKIDGRSDVNWSEVFKEGLRKKLETLEQLRAKGAL